MTLEKFPFYALCILYGVQSRVKIKTGSRVCTVFLLHTRMYVQVVSPNSNLYGFWKRVISGDRGHFYYVNTIRYDFF